MAITIDAGVLGMYQYQAGPLMRQAFQYSLDQILNPEEEEEGVLPASTYPGMIWTM
jgi:hypothetical protein